LLAVVVNALAVPSMFREICNPDDKPGAYFATVLLGAPIAVGAWLTARGAADWAQPWQRPTFFALATLPTLLTILCIVRIARQSTVYCG
jgi:hypothetical protein